MRDEGLALSASSHIGQRVLPEPIIRVRDLVVGFGDRVVMKGLDLDIRRGEILGFVGPSGQGKYHGDRHR